MTRSIGINILRLLTALSVLFTHFGSPTGVLKVFFLTIMILLK